MSLAVKPMFCRNILSSGFSLATRLNTPAYRHRLFHTNNTAMGPFELFKMLSPWAESKSSASTSQQQSLSKKRKISELDTPNRKKVSPTDLIKDEMKKFKKPKPKQPQPLVYDPVKKYNKYKPIIWIDCEMTGLDHNKDHIIEICCLVTDKNLNILDEQGYESVIHCPKETMDQMNEWCIQHHGDSGLTAKVINSTKTLEQVENELLEYISKYVTKGVGIMAGNSIHMDRLFMLREMPKVTDFLMYRLIDVSTIMEISKRHNKKVHHLLPPKIGAHTAKMDIIESINQLKFYNEVYFKSPKEVDGDAVKAKWGNKDVNGNELTEDHQVKKDYQKETTPTPETV